MVKPLWTKREILTEMTGPGILWTLTNFFSRDELGYAHSRGVIHRDLKPANIMVGAFGEVQVMDWGLAKVLLAGGVADEKKAYDKQQGQSVIQTLRSQPGSDAPGTFGTLGSQTQMGSVMGTPAYMPPEQALGEIDNLDERADVFGLGAILCEILTGKPPYVADDGTRVFRMASRGKLDDCFLRLDDCGADGDLIALTRHCLELEPVDRPRDAGVLAERVTAYLESVEKRLRETEISRAAETARADEAMHTAREQEAAVRAQRRVGKLLYAIATLLLLSFVTAGVGAFHFHTLEGKQRTLAQEKSNLAIQNEKLANDRESERNAAVAARDGEAEQRRIAEDALKSEANLRALAESREQTIRETLYTVEMNLAGQAAQDTSGIRRVLELIGQWMDEDSALNPEPTTTPPDLPGAQRDLRGWEWYYLWSLCHQARLSHRVSASCVDWSPDGQHFASGSLDGQIRIWNAHTGSLQKQFAESIRTVITLLSYSPDGRKIAVGGLGKRVSVFDPENGALLTTLPVDYHDVRTLSWSPDGNQLVIAGVNLGKSEGEISLWDSRTGERIKSTTTPSEVLLGSGDWSPEGTRLVVSGHIYDTETLEVVSIPGVPTRQAASCQFNPQGDLIAMATSPYPYKDIEIRSAESSELKVRLTGHGGGVLSIRWSPDGKLIASGDADNTVRIWDVASGRELAMLRGHSDGVADVQWNPDGKQLVSVDNVTINVWDYEALSRSFSPQVRPSLIRTLAWDAEGQVLAASGGGGLHLFDAETGQVLAEADPKKAGNWCQFSPTADWNTASSTIAVTHDDDVLLLDDHSLEQRLVVNVPGRGVRTIGMSPDGTKLAVVTGNLGIKIFDASTGNELITALESVDVSSICWSPDGSQIACNNLILDGTTGKVVCRLNPEHQTGWFQSMAWSPTDNRIAVACHTRMIMVFDAATGVTQQTLLGHTGIVESVAWSPDGTRLASCSQDKTVRIWNPDNGALLLTLSRNNENFTSVAWSPDGVRLASASREGEVHIWDAYAGYRNLESPVILQTLNRRLTGNPDLIEDLRLRSKLLEKLGNLAAATQDRERILEVLQRQHAVSPNDLVLLEQMAELSVEIENWPAAIAAYSQLILLEPTESNWLAKRAAVYVASEQMELAKADLLRALEHSSQDVSENLAAQLFDLVLTPSASEWTVIKPTLMNSSGGATLTLQDDGSILASGENSSGDVYTIQAAVNIPEIRCIRLEALPDPSLPRQGPGRHPSGNLQLATFRVFASTGDDGEPTDRLTIADAWASNCFSLVGGEGNVLGTMADEDPRFWHVFGRSGERHVAMFELAAPLRTQPGKSLIVQCEHRLSDLGINLGRFRLSVSADADAFDREQRLLASMKLTNPWAKLGAAHALDGQHDSAVHYFSRALENTKIDADRKEIVQVAASFDEVFAKLISRLPDDPQLQLALARGLVADGQTALAQQAPADALRKLTQADELFTRLLAPVAEWTVLAPVEMKSEAGAIMELQKDGSVFVQQQETVGTDTYTLVFETKLKGLRGLRLEALADSRLPYGGPGWSPLNGNFVLSELSLLKASSKHPDQSQPIVLNDAWADFNQSFYDVRGAVDDNLQTGWAGQPEFHMNHTAVFETAEEVGEDRTTRLTVRLDQQHSYPRRLLGRFRLAFTNDAKTFEATRIRLTVNDNELAECYAALGSAHAQQGATDESIKAFTRGLDLDINADARAKIIYWAARAGLLEQLVERRTGDAYFQVELARYYVEQATAPLAEAARGRARAILEEQLADNPDDQSIASVLAEVLLLDCTWTVLEAAKTTTEAGTRLVQQDDGSILIETPSPTQPEVVSWQPAANPVQALRIETSTHAVPPTNGAPFFNEYQIVAASLLDSPPVRLRGRYVRLDLPGDSPWISRQTLQGKKTLNLSEFQVFEGSQNIALGKAARQSTNFDDNRILAAAAVDGDTNGNDTTNSYAHTRFERAPWWEVDLGSEQAIDRMVIWNRADEWLWPRMNHFRVRVLDQTRKVVFEQVIEKAPNPSTEINPQLFLAGWDSGIASQNRPLTLRLPANVLNADSSRFRVSVSTSLTDLGEEEKREQVRNIPNPWAKLAAAYHIVGAEEQLRKLLTDRPAAAAGVGELHLLAKRWQQAIDFYDTLITQETTDVSLLSHRAQAHASLENWELAKADWSRAVQEAPELNREVFLAFHKANRVHDAAEFGLLAIEQRPDDLDLWDKVAPILLLAGNEDGYRKECVRMAGMLAATTDGHWLASRHCLTCLLWPDAVDLSKLPQQAFVVPNEAVLNTKGLAEVLTARALLDYRSGDFQAALESIQKSMDHQPYSQTIALNLAVQALAQHALGESEKAVITLERASKQLASSQRTHKDTGYLPYAAEVMLREAEANIGKAKLPDKTDE